MDLGISGKVALVTGGSRGIGRQCALSLAAEGVNVAICARNMDTLTTTVDEISKQGVKSIPVVGDVTDEKALSSIYNEISDKLGPVDILVNNAGGSLSKADITGLSLTEFKETFELNLFSSLQMMKLSLPHMRNQKWGRIINIASIWGREYGGSLGYMSAKAALIAATKSTARSLAKDGVLLNTIAPGSIAHDRGSWERFQNENTEEVVQGFIESNLPLGKFGWPEPVGDLVAFLSSDRAGMITGACLVVDGGQSYSLI